MPLDEQLQRLARLPDDSVVIFTSYRADVLGRSMVTADVLRLVVRASNSPTFAASESWLGKESWAEILIRYGVHAQQAAAWQSACSMASRLHRSRRLPSRRPR